MSLVPFLLLVALAAFFGGLYRPDAWYQALSKPAWPPPGWLFAPVWSALYLAMAIAGWQAWKVRSVAMFPLRLWMAQLLLNALWTWLFFGLHRIGWALVDIWILEALVLAFIALAWKPRRSAALRALRPLDWLCRQPHAQHLAEELTFGSRCAMASCQAGSGSGAGRGQPSPGLVL